MTPHLGMWGLSADFLRMVKPRGFFVYIMENIYIQNYIAPLPTFKNGVFSLDFLALAQKEAGWHCMDHELSKKAVGRLNRRCP